MKRGPKPTILIVEDEAPLLHILRDQFTQDGFDVIASDNGVEGLVLALKKQPNLILLDVLMPKKDGISMLKQLRIDERGRNIPVIMLTNVGDASVRAEAFAYKATDYLVKSDYNPVDVVAKVKTILNLDDNKTVS
jgi:DNA-binding response OmpR family regulator